MTVDWLGLRDRAVLVAGAGGLGAAIAVAFVDAGARVAVVDMDTGRLDALRQEVLRRSGDALPITADLSTAAACRDTAAAAAAALGGVDVFVHAVGTNDRRPVLDTPDDVWEHVIRVNLSSAFWLGQAIGHLMYARGRGRMVFISSVSGVLAHPHHASYAASKGALNQLIRVMAREWATSGLTVNAVAPGYTETDLNRDYLARPGMREEMISLVPAARLGAPGDVVGPVLFLASDQAAFVTGQVLYVDGGRTLV